MVTRGCDCPKCSLIRALVELANKNNCECDACQLIRQSKMQQILLLFPRAADLIGFNKDELSEMMAAEFPENPPLVNRMFLDKVFAHLAANPKTRLTDEFVATCIEELISDESVREMLYAATVGATSAHNHSVH